MGRTSTTSTPEGHLIRFQCHHCPYSSPNKHNLMLHINSHRGHRPYQCRYCPYAASQPSTVRTHTRVRHRDRCKYKCIHCEFYCQKERAISLHLERYHSITTYSIVTYLNTSYVDDQYAAPSDGISVLKGRPSIYDRQARMSSLMNSSTNLQANQMKSLNIENMMALHQNLSNAGPPSKMQILTSGSEYNAIVDYAVLQNQEKTKAINNDCVKPNSIPAMDTNVPLNFSTRQSPIHTDDSGSEVADSSETIPNVMESHYECDQCDYACAYESQFIKHLMTQHKDSGIVVVDPSQESSSDYPAVIANGSSEYRCPPTGKSLNGSAANSKASDIPKDAGFSKIVIPVQAADSHVEYPRHMHPQDSGRPDYASINHVYTNTNTISSQSYDAAIPNKISLVKTEPSSNPEHINGVHNLPRHMDLASASSRMPSKRKMLNPVQRVDRSRASPTTSYLDSRTIPTISPAEITHDQATQTNNHPADNPETKQEQLQFVCPHCKIIFPDNLLFVIHRGSHGFNNPFQCNMCGFKACDKYEFASHLHGCPITK